MLRLWLAKKYNTTKHAVPSWRSLCIAVNSGAGNPALAEDIATRHCKSMHDFI